MFPKTPKKERSRSFLEYVCSLPCMTCPADPCNNAHHRLRDTGEKWGASKSGDDKAVNICHGCHDELHKLNGDERAFFSSHGFDDMPEYSKNLFQNWLDYHKK